MKDIDELLHLVMPYAPECPEPLAIQALRDKATELCRRTRIWKQTISVAITSIDGTNLEPPEGARIFEVKAPTYDGLPLTPVAPSWLDERNPGWQAEEAAPARFMTQETPNTVRVVPFVAGVLTVRLTLLPTKNASELPDFLVDEYASEIAYGAISEVLLTPAADFANPKLAAVFAQRFQSEMDRLSVAVAKGQQGARLRTKPRFL